MNLPRFNRVGLAAVLAILVLCSGDALADSKSVDFTIETRSAVQLRIETEPNGEKGFTNGQFNLQIHEEVAGKLQTTYKLKANVATAINGDKIKKVFGEYRLQPGKYKLVINGMNYKYHIVLESAEKPKDGEAKEVKTLVDTKGTN